MPRYAAMPRLPLTSDEARLSYILSYNGSEPDVPLRLALSNFVVINSSSE